MTRIEFSISGRPKPLKRHRDGKYGGKYDPSKKDKGDFAMMAKRWKPSEPFAGPVELSVSFNFKRPKKPVHDAHIIKPDGSNLFKFVEDALTGIFWVDDRQVISGLFRKEFADCDSTDVEIVLLDNE